MLGETYKILLFRLVAACHIVKHISAVLFELRTCDYQIDTYFHNACSDVSASARELSVFTYIHFLQLQLMSHAACPRPDRLLYYLDVRTRFPRVVLHAAGTPTAGC